MKSDEVLQWLESYDLSHRHLNQTPGATAQSECCFGSASLKSPCSGSAHLALELVTAIIVEDWKCPCSGPLLAARDDRSVPFTRHREMSVRCKAAWFWGTKSHHGNKQNLALMPEASPAWHTTLSGFTRRGRSPRLDSAARPVLSLSLAHSFFNLSDEVLFIQSACLPDLYIENLVRVHLKCVAGIDKQSFWSALWWILNACTDSYCLK